MKIDDQLTVADETIEEELTDAEKSVRRKSAQWVIRASSGILTRWRVCP